jgi:hypothetical protein
LDVIPENKMIFSSNNSEIVGFNTNIFEYHKFVVPVKHNDVLVTTLATDLFRNNESLSIINLQNVEKFSDSLGGAFTGCSNITEISIASDNVNLQL